MSVSKETYHVEVDYSKTLEQMIEEAQFDYINSGITSEHFHVNGEGRTVGKMVLFSYPDNRNTEDIIDDIRARGYRPAKIEELVALATKYPTLQQKGNPIIGFGTMWSRAENERVVPVLRGGDQDRNMHLLRINNKWNPSELFAAVKV